MDFIHTWALWPCNSIVLFHLISNPSETVHQLILQWRVTLFPFYPVTPPSCFLLAPLVCPSTSLSTQPKQKTNKNRDLVSTTAASLYHQWNNCKGMFMLGATAWILSAWQAPVWTWLLWLPLLCQHSQKITTGILLAPLLPLSITSGITVRACSCWVPLPGYCAWQAPVWTWLLWLPLLCQHSQKITTGILLAPLLPLSITSGITVLRACWHAGCHCLGTVAGGHQCELDFSLMPIPKFWRSDQAQVQGSNLVLRLQIQHWHQSTHNFYECPGILPMIFCSNI